MLALITKRDYWHKAQHTDTLASFHVITTQVCISPRWSPRGGVLRVAQNPSFNSPWSPEAVVVCRENERDPSKYTHFNLNHFTNTRLDHL